MNQPVNGIQGQSAAGANPVGKNNSTFNGNYAAAGFNPFAPLQMQTLVYSPDIRIVIEAQNGTQYDVSKDIVRGSIVRKENSVSSLFVTLANKPAQKGGAPRYNVLFDRMDKIICYAKRTQWVTVFTGYLDTVPFAQMYPGMCELKASCTLKRLIHHWWNPALPESMLFFDQFGYASGNYGINGTTQSAAGLPADSGLGNMLADILNKVGGWAPQDILIQNFPMQFLTFLEANYQQIEQKNQPQVLKFRQMLLGGDDVRGGAGYGGASYQSPVGTAASLPGPTGTGQNFYLTEIVAAADQRSMGPSSQDIATAQDLTNIGQIGAAAGTRDAQAWQALQNYPGVVNTTTARASDAAILAVACATAVSGMMNFANLGVPESLNSPNDGPNPTARGQACGLFQEVASQGWGTVANEMNPRLAAGMFLDHLSSFDWRNMDPAAAIASVQNSYPASFFQPFIAAAGTAVQAYRQAQQGGGTTTGTGGLATGGASGLPPIGGNLAGAVAATPSTGPTSPTTVTSGVTPVPDASGAIAYAQSKVGSPYTWGGNGPTTFDCLMGGTLITTERGQVPIEKLTTDDKVLTRQGYRRVLMTWKVRDNAKVIRVDVDGHSLTGTPDHRVWTENRGWVKLEELDSFDTLVSCHTAMSPEHVRVAENHSWASQVSDIAVADVDGQPVAKPDEGKILAVKQSAFTSKGWPTTVILTPTDRLSALTSKGQERLSTSRSGSITTALSHKGMRSTTPITTPSTTTQQTWTASQSLSTAGKVREPDDYTTTSAHSAESSSRHSKHLSALTDSAVFSTSRNITTTAVEQRLSVYDVMVEDVHEFFANGILVHNCSGFVSAAYASIGVYVPRLTTAIAAMPGRVFNTNMIQPGDLIVSPAQDHVVMALTPGGGTIIEASGNVHVKPQYYNLGSCTVIHVCNASGLPAAPFNPAATANNNGTAPTTPVSSTGYSGSATSGAGISGSSEPIARNLFSYMFDPGMFASQAADLFVGEKAFIDDQPLIQMVQAICKSGLRNFASAPTGEFVAYYPDWFGLDGKKAILELEDIECKDVRVNYSDDPLTTHVYVAGDTTMKGESMGELGWLDTCGVVTVEDQWLYQRLTSIAPSTVQGGIDGTTLLNRFGVRPYKEEQTLAGSHALEFLIATHIFMLKWAEQYQTTVEFTFMPELFPGMRVNLKGHDLQVYVTEVTHTFDFEGGFSTSAKIMAPSSGTASSNVTGNSSSNPSSGAATANPSGKFVSMLGGGF